MHILRKYTIVKSKKHYFHGIDVMGPRSTWLIIVLMNENEPNKKYDVIWCDVISFHFLSICPDELKIYYISPSTPIRLRVLLLYSHFLWVIMIFHTSSRISITRGITCTLKLGIFLYTRRRLSQTIGETAGAEMIWGILCLAIETTFYNLSFVYVIWKWWPMTFGIS